MVELIKCGVAQMFNKMQRCPLEYTRGYTLCIDYIESFI